MPAQPQLEVGAGGGAGAGCEVRGHPYGEDQDPANQVVTQGTSHRVIFRASVAAELSLQDPHRDGQATDQSESQL